jgi:thioredoxin-like negative regulator of GroEL
MPDDKLTAADPGDLAAALALALQYAGRKRTHNADEIMAEIVREAAGRDPASP